MAHPYVSNENGISPHQLQQNVGEMPQLRTHPFSLEEALPYTPFTSVIPFNADILSNLSIGSGSHAPSLASLVSRDDFDALNKDCENQQQSQRLEGSLEYVSNLLKAEKITEFQFKTAPKTSLAPKGSAKNKCLTHRVAPFAKMVYENTSIAFRHPSTDRPSDSPSVSRSTIPPASKKSSSYRKSDPPKIVKHNPAAINAQGVAKNKSRIEIHLPTQAERNAAAAQLEFASKSAIPPPVQAQPQTVSMADLMVKSESIPAPLSNLQSVSLSNKAPMKQDRAEPLSQTPISIIKAENQITPPNLEQLPPHDPSSTPSSQRPIAISVELPKPSFNREEFAVVPDSPDAPTHLSMRRTHGDTEDHINADLNQRERAKMVFADLRRGLHEIFAAEGQVSSQPGSSSNLVFVTPEQEPAMTSMAHERAQKLLLRAIQEGCFAQAPFNDLFHLQNLSEASLKQADALDFKISREWGETEVGFWVNQLDDIMGGLRAARTALRVMCGGREEKQLYSENLIQLCLNVFRNVMDGIIVPLSELRASDPTTSLFRAFASHKDGIKKIFVESQKLYGLMSDLISRIELSDTVINSLEFVSSSLMFVENAHSEKDSVVGVQRFDGLRIIAMNVLSQIFLMNPAQRIGILNDILTSLEKLPVSKQKARQFKISDGGSIQPISALIMRLIQASAGKVDEKGESESTLLSSIEHDSAAQVAPEHAKTRYTIRTEDHAAGEHETAIHELQDLAEALTKGSSYRYANHVVNFIVQRALKSTKTGDTPYRNLLDLFVEDFTTCLGSPDWPAAELLLRFTMGMMFNQIDGEKNPAPAKNMGLELLGIMGASISKLRSHVRKSASSFEGSSSDELGVWLADLSLTVLDGTSSSEKALKWEGPYRIILEHLQGRTTKDVHLSSATSYLVADWGSQIQLRYEDAMTDGLEEQFSELGRTAFRLRNMIEDPKWLSREWRFQSVEDNHAKLAYDIILLRSVLCTAFGSILNRLLNSMTTDQATVRSRSLKSVTQILETDPTILEGENVFVDIILQCSSDSSPQVRDSALGLIGKCISLRPSLEYKMIPTVVDRVTDAGVGVRKRAMKLARDIYLGNEDKGVRSRIANSLLHRMQDPDEGVRELARQMIEEIWISPFYKDDDSIAFKQSLTDHVALMVQTAKHGSTNLILDKVFQTMLSPDPKSNNANNTRVCLKLVANMFDLLDNPDSDDPLVPSGKDALQVLTIFAKADPKLFTFEQIQLLKPYIESVGTSEDLAVSRAVVVIYRRVLPQVSSIHSQFLAEIRKYLLPATAKITRALLDDVMACIWIISGLLKSTENVARLLLSCLAGIQGIRGTLGKGLDQKQTKQFDRYSLIVGMAGKHCQLDDHEDLFRTKFPNWKEHSVSKLMVDLLCPFANPSLPVTVRKPALDAIGLICQSNPRNFVAPNVISVFEQVFKERTVALELMVLRSLKEFLFTEEQRSDQANTSASKEKKDLKVMGSTSFDDVASATTQRFLDAITRISLATQDDHAFLAVEILASINRQGLVHPKETGVTLITLETCPVTRISELAYHEHKALHEKYESVLEREYAKAIQSAFQYQRDIVQDPRGATISPFTSKLHLLAEILKISKSKSRVKCLQKIVAQLEFEPSELDISQGFPSHVSYSRFLIENLAFLEYVSVGDLQAVVGAMEKLVTGTGAGIAQTMESEIFQVRVDQDMSASQSIGDEATSQLLFPHSIDQQRLRQLTAGSMILSAIWEARTYLRRLFGLNPNRRESKSKGPPKDLTKAPVRVQGVTGDKFWDDVDVIMSSLDTPEGMMRQCKAFVDLMNVDSEVKIADEDEDLDADGELQTPEALDEDDEPAADGRGRKRKGASTPGGRKKRARSNSRPRPRGRPKKNSVPEADDSTMDDDQIWF
ncbi:hypothetical protein F5Y16DRAFT_354703 [Xylariaceae sp. FL0255]|nr:hypothetical protein F5Y16DRAFT_354703 [Xylariaceae sp. FL0255]